MIPEEINNLYHTLTGSIPVKTELLSAAGSNRKYFRLYGNPTVIGVHGTSCEENNAFIYLSSFFKQNGLPVPEVYNYSPDKQFYLQEDLGDGILFDEISHGRNTDTFTVSEKELLHKAIKLLPAIQFAGCKGLDYSQCYPQPAFNQRSVFWDLNYFKYYFLKISGVEFQEDKLEDDFGKLGEMLLQDSFDTFMYRDFQSRNIMIKENELFLIDFQGGRKGPVYYDLASFLWQAKANFPENLREELIESYLQELRHHTPVNSEEFKKQLRLFVLFRTLQVLGAYGFRGLFEKKSHFIQSIPFALANLKELLHTNFPGPEYLHAILSQLTEIDFNPNK